MIHFECTVQEGCLSDDLRPRLTSAIEKACRDALGHNGAPVEVSWTVIPNGFGIPRRTAVHNVLGSGADTRRL